MKLARLEPFAATPATVVDYEAELKKLQQKWQATSAVETEVSADNPTQDETQRALARLADFLAAYRQQRKPVESLDLVLQRKRKLKAKALRAYLYYLNPIDPYGDFYRQA